MKTLTNPFNYGATLAQASEYLANRETFHTGTLSASWESEDDIDGMVYAVRSYGVLIAWVSGGIPAVNPSAYNYSTTTSKHANLVKKAWAL
jgi:hypothetical protein